jgi:hypothetical protein
MKKMSRMENSSNRKFVDEALRLAEEAQKKGIVIRIIGAIAVELHCPKYSYLRAKMDRPPHKDVDLITRGKYRNALKDFFAGMGYKSLAQMAVLYGQDRHTYIHKTSTDEVDVYFDKLDYCHRINLAERLELDKPTITPSDILLQKMQIVVINEKDLIDASVLLREHDVRDTDGDMINASYISRLLSHDWGFYYTFTRNLEKVKSRIVQIENIENEDKSDICSKIDKISQYLTSQPKSVAWKARSKIGTKKKWYKDIEGLPGRP